MVALGRLAAVGLLALAVSACVSTLPLAPVVAARTTEQVSETNYVLGENRTAVVGEAVVRVKDYVRTLVSSPALRASRQANYTMGMNAGSVSAGVDYPLVAERTVDGERLRVITVNDIAMQIRDDGSVYPKGLAFNPYNREWIPVLPNMNVTPADVRFEAVMTVDRSSAPAGENFEILFTGRDANGMRFQYREYTADDLARAAFSQELVYPADARTIRFKGMTIEILELGSDSVRYRVTARTANPR